MANPRFLLLFSFLVLLGLSVAQEEDFVEHTLEHNRLVRYYIENKLDDLQDSSALVILLHGGFGSMRQNFEYPGTRRWVDLAKENGFLLLSPNGASTLKNPLGGQTEIDTDGTVQFWNDLVGSQTAEERVDDVGFIAKLIDWAVTERNVDASRVYVTGISNGGMFLQRLLIERPELFAAGASFIGNLPEEEVDVPDSATPLFLMMGSEDYIVPFEGGPIPIEFICGVLCDGDVRSALETRDFFISAMGADPDSVVREELPNIEDDGCVIQSELYSPADLSGEPVLYYTMVGGGHSPPYTSSSGKSWEQASIVGNICRDADGVDLAWDFMSQFRSTV